MKKINKFLSLVLGTGMIIGASGCKGDNGGFNMDETDADITEITILSGDMDTYQTDGVDKNTPVYQALKAAVGFDVFAKTGVSNDQLPERIKLLHSTDALPEVFRIHGPYNSTLYQYLIEEEAVVAIDEYVNEATKDVYPYLYEHMKQFEYMKSNVTYANGHIYFVPTYWGNEKCMYVRTDWIDNLNAKLGNILVTEGVISSASQMTNDLYEKHKYVVPTTLTEFYRLARAFTMHDPDGNGVKDTYGYVTETNRDYDSWMYVACDTGWKQWMEDVNPLTGAKVNAGTYVNSNTSDGSKIATAIFSKMYKEGYVTPSSVSNTEGLKQDQFTKGQAGMMYQQVERYNYVARSIAQLTSGDTPQERFQNAMKRFAIALPPAGKNGTYGGHSPYSSCYLPGPAINANMSEARIKKCLSLFEFFYSPEGQKLFTYGVEGVNYETQADGTIKMLNAVDQYGVMDRLTANNDNAARFTYMMELPYQTLGIITNGDKIVDMITKTNASQCMSDYLDVITPTAEKWIVRADECFDSTSWLMMRNVEGDCFADWTFDEKTWATDGWTKLYTVSSTLNTKWSSYVNTYNKAYKGTDMYDEYNAYVASGVLQKRPGL